MTERAGARRRMESMESHPYHAADRIDRRSAIDIGRDGTPLPSVSFRFELREETFTHRRERFVDLHRARSGVI
jgi:hypothetical protein